MSVGTDSSRIVIVGAGQAGGELAANLREQGYSGSLTLVGEEPILPYSRPPLSKAYFQGSKTAEDLLIRGPGTYEKHGIDTLTGFRVSSVDRQNKHVVLDDGRVLRYDYLILATGGSARPLPDAHFDSALNVFKLRTIADVDTLRAAILPGRRLTVIGGGFVGLELGSVAAEMGAAVTVIEREDRLLARVTAQPLSRFLEQTHRDHGVVIHTGRTIESVEYAEKRVRTVTLDDGTTVEVDVCLAAVGLRPRTELAEAIDLEVADGILVDKDMRTSDPAIFAIGDVARQPCDLRGGTRRLESISNATEHARSVAAVLCRSAKRDPSIPWFWSDQYNLKIQMVGLPAPEDEVVVRSTGTSEKFSVFYLRERQLRAAEVVSSPRDFAAAKKLVARRAEIAPSVLQDASVRLSDL